MINSCFFSTIVGNFFLNIINSIENHIKLFIKFVIHPVNFITYPINFNLHLSKNLIILNPFNIHP